ncbi:hypothetical protein FXW78_12780 [Rhodococcus opacus]|nr:hypothetical protein [Rhodococcus opacus]RZL74088.1 MAG: hypothetical protein EOP32_35720 [Rhodococcus sp. (in: high G+C Gram-positive bacteria)]
MGKAYTLGCPGVRASSGPSARFGRGNAHDVVGQQFDAALRPEIFSMPSLSSYRSAVTGL